ncbi:hypothetical protein [Jeotgalibacillus salarius]|uniref:DUF2577 domain-containing protein n=1 Tax=Jeotgalibacillus salarius TaxID=546023 RepID=A0A4Y8LJR5_9BACL|nr:hypothetical protein [Jeotgalibacillus salarius]TFE02892.1 hypothetical protein E2626_03545 [Jeotgalibacillus salarius]
MKPNLNQGAGALLQVIREEVQRQLTGGRRKREPRQHVLGTIDAAYANDGSRPSVVIDGDPSPIGPFPYLSHYEPSAGDRVLLAKSGNKYVVTGKIV